MHQIRSTMGIGFISIFLLKALVLNLEMSKRKNLRLPLKVETDQFTYHQYNNISQKTDVRIDGNSSNISNTRDSVSSGYPNTEKRVENTTRSGVFLTKFEMFG